MKVSPHTLGVGLAASVVVLACVLFVAGGGAMLVGPARGGLYLQAPLWLFVAGILVGGFRRRANAD